MQLRRPLHERVPHQQSTIAQLIQGRSFYAKLQTSLTPNQTYGSPTPTFSRNLAGNFVTDFEGLQRPTLANEARMMGSRRVANQVNRSEGVLSGFAGANQTVTSGVSDPFGGTNASTITATNATATWYQQFGSILTGHTYVNSLWARRRTGTGTVSIYDAAGNPTTITTTSSWQRFSIALQVSVKPYLGMQLATNGDAIDVYGIQQEDITGQTNQNPSEYVSVGVLSAPYHGAGVDGVRYFDTLNGNTVI